MAAKKLDTKAALKTLNRILEAELAGVVRYTHYSFMVFGYSRIPIIGWLESQATESLQHARQAGEMITHLGGQPSLGIGRTLEAPLKSIGDIMRDALEHERAATKLYRELLAQTEGRSLVVEEYARGQIATEELHAGEIEKMLRHPGG
jgi:bacterioferritin